MAKIYKINYKNRYFPFWDYASAEVIFAPAETSAVALGRPCRYRIIICMFLTSFYAHFCILCAQLVG